MINTSIKKHSNSESSGNNMATEYFAAYVDRIMQIIRITETILPLQKC